MTKPRETRRRVVNKNKPRFAVRSVTGFATSSKWTRKQTTTWYVMDRLHNWAIVGTYTRHPPAYAAAKALNAGRKPESGRTAAGAWRTGWSH